MQSEYRVDKTSLSSVGILNLGTQQICNAKKKLLNRTGEQRTILRLLCSATSRSAKLCARYRLLAFLLRDLLLSKFVDYFLNITQKSDQRNAQL